MIAGGTASADLAISTSSVPLPAVARERAGSQGSGEPGAPAAALAALLLLLLPLRPSLRERLRGGLALLLLGVLLVGTNGCGADIRIPFHLVPTGTYQIPVMATDANHNTQTALLTLTVTP